MVIKSYLEGIGQPNRNVSLIPSSAHGTNPASAVMSGMKVVIVKCDDNGNIDSTWTNSLPYLLEYKDYNHYKSKYSKSGKLMKSEVISENGILLSKKEYG